MRTGADEHEFSIDDGSIDATVELAGRVGFVEVELTGSDAANPVGGVAFSVGKFDVAEPVLAVDIVPDVDGVVVGGLGGGDDVADAILLTDLLSEVTERVDAQCNLRVSGGLEVAAEANCFELASGTVAFNWTDIFSGDCTPDAGVIATLDEDPLAAGDLGVKRL